MSRDGLEVVREWMEKFFRLYNFSRAHEGLKRSDSEGPKYPSPVEFLIACFPKLVDREKFQLAIGG